MKNIINSNKDYSISLIRLIATIIIVTCHFMQYYNCELTWWFNVGVQIFFTISGYLLAFKIINSPIEFLLKRFKRILIDYWIFVLIYSIFYIIAGNKISKTSFVFSVFCIQVPNGADHLWFISYILLCYILTPLLFSYFNYFLQRYNKKHLWIFYIILIILIFLVFQNISPKFTSVWINCYLTGYFLGFIYKNKLYKISKLLSLFILVFALIMNTVQIYIDYFSSLQEIKSLEYYVIFCGYSHTFLGCGLFIIMKQIFSRIKYNNKSMKVLSISDNLSYDIYLVHQIFILGVFSLLKVTDVIIINILFTILVIIVSAILLRKLSAIVNKLFP